MATIACFAPPGAHTSALYCFFDILATAQGASETQPSKLNVKIVSSTKAPVRGWNNRVIIPDSTISDTGIVDAIFIPPIGDIHRIPSLVSDDVLEWIRQNLIEGATLASAASGIFVLAQAGVLDGEKATTHFAWAEEFKSIYPQVVLHEKRTMLFSGPAHRIVTSGGGAYWNDLALFLISRYLGKDATLRSAKYYLVDWGRRDQLSYASMEATRLRYDAQINKALSAIKQNLTQEDVFHKARSATNLPVRTFERRFKAATGTPLSQYIQQMRIELAKELLESDNISIDDLTIEVGYSDATSFRRLFIKNIGMTPSEYRRRFSNPL
ncbi:GlxA family transcriptional regulator [Pseudovibrio sp. Alg231-02]|uniref:GlxA family transcriptional regulator n=1 Tax=Pseudovibrio sp. Alg231-02 TaxID=1922223 RepID=UPI000D55F71A|nr:helix-turn-helix domain-containing protein [Pseudovibrio sp. Alg231-02]